jgi:hypothetical protein
VVLAATERVWDRDDYRGQPQPGWQPEPPPRREAAPAIEAAPHREAIVTPYASPAAVTASHDPISPLPPVSDAEPVPIHAEETPAWLTETTRPTAASRTGSASG